LFFGPPSPPPPVGCWVLGGGGARHPPPPPVVRSMRPSTPAGCGHKKGHRGCALRAYPRLISFTLRGIGGHLHCQRSRNELRNSEEVVDFFVQEIARSKDMHAFVQSQACRMNGDFVSKRERFCVHLELRRIADKCRRPTVQTRFLVCDVTVFEEEGRRGTTITVSI